MLYIKNDCVNPWYNLSLEEYFLKRKDIEDDILCLWQNENAVIIGKHQNTLEQVNQSIAMKYGVKIARRITGGGAVYHDMGNLNYSYITSFSNTANIDFRIITLPIIKALKNLGIDAKLSGRNDIIFKGRKISGTAQAGIGSRILFHGTILYDVNTDILEEVLKVDEDKIKAKGIKSFKNRVINLKDYLPDSIDVKCISDEIIKSFSKGSDLKKYVLSERDIYEIEKYQMEKHSRDEWIYRESGQGNIRNKRKFNGGIIKVIFDTDRGVIRKCNFEGDYIGIYDTEEIEKDLEGILFKYNEVERILDGYIVKNYFGDITKEELMNCIFNLS